MKEFGIGLAMLVAALSPLDAQACLSSANRIGKQGDHQNWIRSDDGKRSMSVRWRRGDCEIRLDARGDFGVKPDLTGIVGVEDGGWVEIEENDGNTERRVRVVGMGRDLEFRWSVNGRNGFDLNRERWLADIRLALERRTAMFAKQRVPELLRSGGTNAVLDETDRMASDYARRTYFSNMLKLARLEDTGVGGMLRQT